MSNLCFSYAGMATSKRFKVETILNYDSELFLVKWVGYKDPTWEPRKNLDQCEKMLWAFTEVCNPVANLGGCHRTPLSTLH